MKHQTAKRKLIQQKEFWTAILLLAFLVSLHLFCTTRLKGRSPAPSMVEAKAPHCFSGVALAGFCAAGDPLDTQMVRNFR